jgi:hypothetical protein
VAVAGASMQGSGGVVRPGRRGRRRAGKARRMRQRRDAARGAMRPSREGSGLVVQYESVGV